MHLWNFDSNIDSNIDSNYDSNYDSNFDSNLDSNLDSDSYSGGYDNSILSFSPFDDKYFGMMDVSGAAVSGMWTTDKTPQFANYTGSWSSISTKRKISVIGKMRLEKHCKNVQLSYKVRGLTSIK